MKSMSAKKNIFIISAIAVLFFCSTTNAGDPPQNADALRALDRITANIQKSQQITDAMVAPNMNVETFDLWVMQTDGKIIYSYKSESTGKNFLPKSKTVQYMSLGDRLKNVVANPSGADTYKIPPVGHADAEERNLYWKSATLGGQEVRVILFYDND